MRKNIIFAILVCAIVGAIWYLEAAKVHPVTAGSTQSIAVPGQSSPDTTPSSTVEGTATRLTLQEIGAADAKNGDQPAVELVDPTGFVNTSTFKLSDLVGKSVILVDFWTYSCINCIRTIPYLNAWYQKYHDQGLEIVGVHTPEFDFEKDINNVKAAVAKFGIKYPVVLDSNYGTWQAYGNLYWPHEYLIDLAGYVVHDQIGEGNYGETEAEIQKLLAQRASVFGMNMPAATSSAAASIQPADLSGLGSPETYFGSARNEYLANGTPSTPGIQNLTDPQTILPNQLYLSGSWNFADQYASNVAAGAKIFYKYHSAKMFFVASAPDGATIEVLQDGKPIGAAAGSDVVNGKAMIKESRLYNLANNPDGAGDHTLEIIIDSPGLQAYTFTFG